MMLATERTLGRRCELPGHETCFARGRIGWPGMVLESAYCGSIVRTAKGGIANGAVTTHLARDPACRRDAGMASRSQLGLCAERSLGTASTSVAHRFDRGMGSMGGLGSGSSTGCAAVNRAFSENGP